MKIYISLFFILLSFTACQSLIKDHELIEKIVEDSVEELIEDIVQDSNVIV